MSNNNKNAVPKNKNKRISLFLWLMLIIGSATTYGQQQNFSGNIFDLKDSTPVKSAMLFVIITSDSLHPIRIKTDDAGLFSFNSIYMGQTLIEINAAGYDKKILRFNLQKEKYDIGPIFLTREGTPIDAVTVISTGAAITQKDDTSQYNSKQFKTNPDATSEDLVKKMPGITVDKNGTVTAQGEQVKKVTVDGKEFFGDDVSAALKNIPAAAVDKVQVYDRLSDQAMMTGIDDGNSQKAINIITKAGINDAQFGRIFAGYGSDNRYNAGGNATFFKGDRRVSLVGSFNNINQQNFSQQDLLGISGSGNNSSGRPGSGPPSNFRGPGGPAETFTIDQSSGISVTNAFGINYADKYGKWGTMTGSYFLNDNDNNNESSINNLILGQNISTQRNANTDSRNTNHRFNARLDCRLDSMNMLFIIPSLNFQHYQSDANTYTKSFQEGGDSLYNANSLNSRMKDGYNLKNNIMFRHSFHKKNRIFSMSFNTTITKNNTDDKLNGRYRYFDEFGFPVFPDSAQNQLAQNYANGYTLGGNLTYNEPLDKKGKWQLQFEYNPSYQKNNADQETRQNDGTGYNITDSLLSNRFENTIITQNGGVAIRFTRSKDEQLSVSVNYQNTNMSSDRSLPVPATISHSFNNIFPFATWRKKISNTSNFRMFYRANSNFPSITQLQDVLNLSNPLNVTAGNKDLVQAFVQTFGGRYSYTDTKTNRNLFVGSFMQLQNNYIANATYIAAADSSLAQNVVLKKGSQLSKPMNIDGYRMIRSYLTVSMPVKKLKSTVSLTNTFMFYRLPGMINNIQTRTDNFQYNMALSFVSNVSEFVDYNISYNANINNAKTTGIGTINNQYINQSVSVVFNLLSKKGWFLQNDLNAQYFKGLSNNLDTKFALWNASVGKKFFKDKTGEIKLTVFDILKQNQSVSRNVTNTFIEDSRSNVLGQYFMLSFAYNLKNFGQAKKPAAADEFLPKVGYPGQY